MDGLCLNIFDCAFAKNVRKKDGGVSRYCRCPKICLFDQKMGTSGFPHVVATVIVMRPAPIQRDFGIEPQIVEFLLFITCHGFDKQRYDEFQKIYARHFYEFKYLLGMFPGWYSIP